MADRTFGSKHQNGVDWSREGSVRRFEETRNATEFLSRGNQIHVIPKDPSAILRFNVAFEATGVVFYIEGPLCCEDDRP